MPALFEASGMDQDPLGLWTPTIMEAETNPNAVSFSLGGDSPDPQPATPIFRVDLPADGAAAALAERERYLQSLSQTITDIPTRIDGLVTRTQERRQTTPEAGLSFSVGEEPSETGPEGELLSLIADAEAQEYTQSSGVSFGIEESASAALEKAQDEFHALLEQINNEVLHFAWVETKVEGSLFARTTIGWTGDAETVFAEGLSDSQIQLHTRNLRIVIQTRNMRLRLVATIASGAAKISALMATPTGALLALPAVYQYAKQIIAQVKQLQSISSS